MICIVCKEKCQSSVRGKPCCPKCRPEVYKKRDELLKTKETLREKAFDVLGKSEQSEFIEEFKKAPEGSITNALNEFEKEE